MHVRTFLFILSAFALGTLVGNAILPHTQKVNQHHTIEANKVTSSKQHQLDPAAQTPEETHHHGTYDVSKMKEPPSVSLSLYKDRHSGWNAHITTTHFAFAPERVSTEHVHGEGHAHIYINNKKINRVYSNWYHLGELAAGEHTVSVRLSTNDHNELTVAGTPLEASQSILIEE